MLSNLLPRLPRRRLLLLALPAAAGFISACATGNPQDTFDTAGPVAKQQADLFKFIFWIAVVVFVLVEGGIIWITLQYRRRSDSEMPKQTHGNTKLELTWTFIPALIIVAIAIPTIQSIWDLAEPPADEPFMTVEAIGHQWWFEFRYPEEEIVTANELVVPVGKNVVVELRSQDVIHSFWVPNLFGKVDMVPTRENQLWFRADREDVYYGQCAEFCDVGHALMRFRVIAEPEDKYNEWVAGMRRAPNPPAAGSPESRGQTLFRDNCSTCHSVDSYIAGRYESEITTQEGRWTGWLANPENSPIVSAPNLTHFGDRITFGAGIRDRDKGALVDWIRDPGSIKPETRMQEQALVYQNRDDGQADLTEQQISDIADYLLSLKPGDAAPGDAMDGTDAGDGGDSGGGGLAAAGQATFESLCSACHSTGPNQIVGPGLSGIGERAGTTRPGLSADEYIRESIKQPMAFAAGGNTNIMPTFPQLSDADIDGLIAYLKTLN